MMQSSFLFLFNICSSFTICFQLPIGHFIHLTNEQAIEREREKTSFFLPLYTYPYIYTTLNTHPIVILMMNINAIIIISKVCHFNSPQSQFERQTDILELFDYSKEDLYVYSSSSIVNEQFDSLSTIRKL